MNKFGKTSRKNLSECDERLQRVAHRVLKIKDHSIIKGHRGEHEQNELFDAGFSKLRWPDGKHNKIPSLAIDVQTYPRPEDEQELRDEQIYLLGLYRGCGAALAIPVRVGGDWDRDGQISNNSWDDLFHVEVDE